MAQRVRFTEQGRAQGSDKENHPAPEMTGILEEWMLHLCLLGKFPTEVLIFLSPIMRSKSKEGKKEDIMSKFLTKFPLFLP